MHLVSETLEWCATSGHIPALILIVSKDVMIVHKCNLVYETKQATTVLCERKQSGTRSHNLVRKNIEL